MGGIGAEAWRGGGERLHVLSDSFEEFVWILRAFDGDLSVFFSGFERKISRQETSLTKWRKTLRMKSIHGYE
jgi:hypothetical protein